MGGLFALVCGVLVMAAAPSADARQREYPVVSVWCDSDPAMCRALVQALAETVPARIYRINPKPRPPQAFDVRLELSRDGAARLHWQNNGAGDIVTRGALSKADLARKLVQSSPALPGAMGARP
ncbi:hypothetical protein [uncultured Tateyamaria sp.]|uniref:hypothetical protein n=1 Tax=Tateyamaria sp. 1078 TaxID=3417464 RepID=UPI002628D709|nr:hypothetical protein [uncultured Tateyamaria sp.]